MYKKMGLLLAFLIFCSGSIMGTVKAEMCADDAPFCRIVQNEYECVDISIETEQDDFLETRLLKEDMELIALVTMAEAEGESEYGKQLVIDTILNRMDSEYYPDTVSEVVYQPVQFSSVWNGRIDRCYVMEEIYRLVEGELQERKNNEVIFFTAGDYSKYGTPLFQEGNHYFSSYE